MLLAGVLLKTGGYALIRFLLPLFPDALAQLTPIALALGLGLYPQPVLDLTALPLAVLAAPGVAP